VALRLGYFPNVTHAPAILGLEAGIFAEALGADVALTTATFSTGTAAIEALFSGAIDATYIGPNPAINAWAQSEGTAIRIVAGTTSGGAALVVREGIDSPEDLRGGKLASPSLGNTQDVALRAWLAEQGLETDLQGGGDVSILPQENSQTLETMLTGDIDGAWVPEPWATRLLLEADGRVLVDERDLWPDGRFVTTHLIVASEYLEKHPDVVRDLLAGHVTAVGRTNADPAEAQRLTNAGIEAITGTALPAEVIEGAWANLTFTVDPIAQSLRESAVDAEAVGLLEPVDLQGIYALDILNGLLEQQGADTVEGF
jgi:NitT/TauT family transport system substrate-binding protein